MKNFIKNLIGGTVGAFLVLLFLSLTYQFNFLGTASLIDKLLPAREVEKVEREVVTFVSEEKEAEEAIKKSQDSIVAIKSYQGGKIIRYGSGIAVTQDGLILTVNQVVPPEATGYQVFVGDRILKASVIYRGSLRNLALLKVSDGSLKPAAFNEEELKPGKTGFIIGKLNLLQKTELFVNRTFVNLVDSQNKKIKLDGKYEDYLSGSAFISGGAFRGMVYVDGGSIIAIPSAFAGEFIKSYLK